MHLRDRFERIVYHVRPTGAIIKRCLKEHEHYLIQRENPAVHRGED